MLYELIAIVRTGSLPDVREIARLSGQLVLRNNGVVRGITNWGPFLLPKKVTKHQTQQHAGHYFVMRFDSSPSVQESLRRMLGLDPRMIRFGVVKVGNGGTLLGDRGMSDRSGKVSWHGGGEVDDSAVDRTAPGEVMKGLT